MATTGPPSEHEQCVVELHDRRPVGLTCAAAIYMRRLEGTFELIAANVAQCARAQQQRLGLLDHVPVPQRGILLGKWHVLALHILPRTVPGFLVEALRWRDYPIVQNLVMLIAAVVVIANFTVDMLYAVFDPRIRYTD